jgi:hypothetical protein
MAALRLSAADRDRCDKLVGMLGPSFDGERLNAIGLLQRMADSYKVPIHELILGGTGGSDLDRLRAERAEREAYEANLRAQRAEQASRATQAPGPAEPDPSMPKLPADWRTLFVEALQLNASRSFLTEWAQNFVSDLIARGTRWPSPKQAVVIVRILAKAAVFGPTTSSSDDDWEDIP